MKTKAQSTAEYAVLIAVLVACVLSAGVYVIGAMNANLKGTEEQINSLDEAGAWEFEMSGGGGGGGGGGGCFLKGTKIILADGSVRAINKIKVGDMILGYNGKGVEPGEVTETFYHPELKGYRIITTEDGQQLKTTDSHLIFRGNDYKPARLLKPGDTIFLLKDNKLKPTRITSVEAKDEIIDLYNLEVAKLHNFFAEGALCHNAKEEDDGDGYEE